MDNAKWFLLLLSLSSIIGCHQPKHNFKEHQVFRYNEFANISSLDPAFSRNKSSIWAVNQLFNGLVSLDDKLRVQPDIAKSWKVTAQNTHYEFTLRSDVYFHKHILFGKDSTRIVTAHDFVYSFDRLKSPELAAPGKWVLQSIKGYKAKNDSTLIIELHKPFPPFLSLLAMKYCSVVPKEAVKYFGNKFRSNPIGTGPFTFKLWAENTKLVLRKNHYYFEKGLPKLEAVAITFLADKQSEFLQFLQGNLDMLNALDASYKDELLDHKGDLLEKYKGKIQYQKAPYLNTEYLGVFMEGKKTENDSLIRRAINIGFDREKMLMYLRNNVGIPATGGFIPKGLISHQSNLIDYQPKKAEELVKKYIARTGNHQPTIAITSNANYLDICEYIQRELQGIGLKVKINILQPANLRQFKANGKLPIFRASWIADYPDGENYMSLFYSKNFTPNGPNYTHFKNDAFDKLYERSLLITSIEERQMLYKKMDSIVIKNAPIIPLYYDESVKFTATGIKGFSTNALDILNLKNTYKLP